MGKKLKEYVHYTDDDGKTTVYGPDDDVPGDVAKHIADSAWDDGEEETEDDRLKAARTGFAATQEFEKADKEAEKEDDGKTGGSQPAARKSAPSSGTASK